MTRSEPVQPDPNDSKGRELRDVIIEFGRHLDILAEQLGAALTEADRECVSVGESFHELAAAKCTIDDLRIIEPERAVLKTTCRQMGESLHAAVVALQYHDRLAQRLALVRAGLDRLTSLLHEESTRTTDEWLSALRDVERVNRDERQRLGPDRAHDESSGAADSEANSTVELF